MNDPEGIEEGSAVARPHDADGIQELGTTTRPAGGCMAVPTCALLGVYLTATTCWARGSPDRGPLPGEMRGEVRSRTPPRPSS